jgi:hypothetical protein
MTAAEHDRGALTRKRSVLTALRYYGRQMASRPAAIKVASRAMLMGW